jgi:IS5 family transposase
LKTNKVRADTTVVPANVAYPTDSGLMAKGVAKLAKGIEKLKGAGLASRTSSRDRTRMMRARARSIGANLRRRSGEAKDEVMTINAEMVRIARVAVDEARRVAGNARRALMRLGDAAPRRLCSIAGDLEITADRVAQIAEQTERRLCGEVPEGATRLVSLHDPDARPIRKGRLGKPVEFGYKAQVVDNEDGVVLDHNVEVGNPPDAPMLVPAVERVARRAGRMPTGVTADRGYGENAVREQLGAIGVRTVVLPTKGKPSASRRAVESRAQFQRLVKWRTGSEGRISCLKRDFGWNRTQLDGIEGVRTWCGYGVFNHNLAKIGALTTSE